MTFAEKYELLEAVTTGTVETFVANDLRRGTRVLVHILDCGQQKPNQPTVQWVLDGFRRLAPEPSGVVIEAGRYSGTFYAYLITELPGEEKLRDWVKRYQLQLQDTQEMLPALVPPKQVPEATAKAVTPSESQPGNQPPVPNSTTPTKGPPLGAFTMAFREFGASQDAMLQPERKGEALEPPPISAAIRLGNPEGTEPDFGAGFPALRSPVADIPAERNFEEPSLDSSAPAEPIPSGRGARPGEFTSFFQGPFANARPTELPPLTQQAAPPKKPVGEFTATFGRPGPPQNETTGSGNNVLSDPPGTFTQLFRDFDAPADVPREPVMIPAPMPSVLPLSPPAMAPVIPEPGRFTGPLESISSTPLAAPISVAPPLPAPVAPPSASEASRAFSVPAPQSNVAAPVIPTGPGEYTRIISAVKASPASRGGDKEPTAKTSDGFSFTAPASSPRLEAPTKPAAPKAPEVKKPQPPSSLPVIITFAVLLLTAVLVVVYFVMRHH